MNNDMNAFELNDEQLAEVAGAGGSLISNVGNPQISLNNSVQINVAVAPTIGVAIGAPLKLDGAHIGLGNTGLLGGFNTHK